MRRTVLKSAALAAGLSLAWLAQTMQGFAQEPRSALRYIETKRTSNENTITVVASGMYCTCTRFAEDMRNVLNEAAPGGLRVLPVLGVGGAQNLSDLLFVKGVDVVIVEQDLANVLLARDPELYKDIHNQIRYITKLFNSELHLLAAPNIKKYDDLYGKKVNFYLKDSMTATAMEAIFHFLNIRVEPTYYDEDMALQKLTSGELAGVAFFEGAPRLFIDKLKVSDGFHLLPLDEESFPGRDLTGLFERYMPADLTHDHYPNLIAPGQVVPTVSNNVVLATYNWPVNSERYQKIANFSNKLFTNIEKFQDDFRHPKWKLVNLAAEVPGWTRFKASKDWLDTYSDPAVDKGMMAAFEKFLSAQQRKALPKQLSGADKKTLFVQFKSYWEKEKLNTRQ